MWFLLVLILLADMIYTVVRVIISMIYASRDVKRRFRESRKKMQIIKFGDNKRGAA